MEAIMIVVACLTGLAYVAWCLRKDRRANQEHQAVMTALSPGPRIRELTSVRPNPMRARNLAGGSQPVFPVASGGFEHVATDYGTYTPAVVDAAILGRADTETHQHQHHVSSCAEAPAHDSGHHVSHHDTCSTSDASYGGFDGGGHHGH